MANPRDPKAIRILIVDDHPIVRDGLAAILSTQTDFEVVGQAGTGSQALEQAQRLSPDIVLLDLEMPDMDGVEALRRFDTLNPRPAALVFTAFDTDERILNALRAGARGYLLKGAPREEIFTAIRIVSGGGSLLQPLVASRLLERIQIDRGEENAPYEELTPRELDVLKLLAQGSTNKDISSDLFITERTVKFHVSSILRKLGATNRTEAVTLAAQFGLVEL